MYSAADYVSPPVVGCSQTYSLGMMDGSAVPAYYDIDSYGQVTIRIDGDMPLIDEQIVITISTSDAVSRSSDVMSTNSIHVKTKCGPSSTDIISPAAFESLSQSANLNSALQIEDMFSSSNPLCPIDYISLSQGTQYYDF